MSDDTKPDPVLAALARIEASMAVFTTELATVITRLDGLQNTLDAIREDIKKRPDATGAQPGQPG